MKGGRDLGSWLGALVLAAAACQEQLAMPSRCPDLCPGEGLLIRDTVLLPAAGRDSTFTGYIAAGEVSALLVSNGLPAGDARAWAIFPDRPDSIFVVGVRYAYTVDSAAMVIQLEARDTAVRGVYLVMHRIPLELDTTTTLEALDAFLTPESVVDSVQIPDSLRSGDFRLRLSPEALSRLEPDETDSTRFAVGFRISAPVPTGVRLGSNLTGAPLYSTFVRVPATDTALIRQTITITADGSNFAIAHPPLTDPDLLFLGGRSGSRTLLRFNLPQFIKDSATIIRATLELVPSQPLIGLLNDPSELQVRAVLVDFGAKSPAFAGAAGTAILESGSGDTVRVEVRGPVATWLGPGGLTPSLLLGLAPEGGTFSRPEFFSTRSPGGGAGAARLRITYAVASRPGFP
ncbi:MAG TPA: hypothetical protein VI383_00985 [Gemmatimonadales bacterium]|nr:hypothetical protein [Gemmatimonadales bacterium]